MRLVGADSGALRLVDIADPAWTVAVAWCGAGGRGELLAAERLQDARPDRRAA
jgi:hypothetical protein